MIGNDAIAEEVLAIKQKAIYWRGWVALEMDSTDMMNSANEVLKLVLQVSLKLRLYIE